MGGSKFGAVAAFSVLLFSAPLQGQRAGPYIPGLGAPSAEIKSESKDDVRETMRQFGMCIATRFKSRAAEFKNLRLDAPDYQSRITKLAVPECLNDGGLRFQATSFRGNLFAAFYTLQFKDGPPPNIAEFAGRFRMRYADMLSPRARNDLALELFGECVALKDPGTVHGLLRSLPGSVAEKSSFQSLSPHFSGCIPAGESLTFSKTILRGALAEGMYWLSAAARDPAVVPTGH